MGGLVLRAEEWTDAPPAVAFSLFGAGQGAGWVFDALCDHVAVGSAVTMRAPIAGSGGDGVDIIGRITTVRPDREIEIAHDQPWRGRITLRFTADRAGTRVRLFAELDESGLEWLLRRRGYPTARGRSPNPRLGLLTTKSGPGSLFAAAVDNLALLAIEEINAEGGVRGRPVELLVGDDATNPATGVAEAQRLVDAGCKTIMVSTTSATFAAVARALASADVLVVQTLMNEGGGRGRLCLQLGERHEDQLAAGVKPLMRMAGGRRWFLAGNDYCWPRSTHAAARRFLPRAGARVVGERLAEFGTRDYSPLIDEIRCSGADIILSTFVGADSAAFERQCHAMGLRDQCLTLAPAMDESTLLRIGEAASRGLFGVSGYIEQLPTDGNAGLLARYRAKFGRWAPPVSSLSVSVFEAIQLWWYAVRRVGAGDPKRISEAMRPGVFELPRGTVRLGDDGRVDQQIYLTAANGAALELVSAP
ncbi:substrate-binding protein [Amycolatopsis thermoflava]|uniref:substrate-binding protein n=1 Tax=Amycolatopsis thermoflava TaxID=84480 RepID=UPI00365803DE